MDHSLVFVASLAFIFTAVNQVLCLPAGIRNILRDELSTPVLVSVHLFSFLMYVGWSIYGVLLKDPAIVFGCGLGVLSSGILLGYTFWLRLGRH
ncbi:MAG: hypothetical protein EOP49_08290 [Sphingobacteriales bacterium]|nr:MAG: hypothetical protein EOP49_08290 [Sphingobacteriales bacterium]